jgi:fatty aldehyde-generating acyl-ACP reductase
MYNKFAFLVHSRRTEDIFRKYSWLKYLPIKVVNFTLKFWPPIIVSKITGLKTLDGQNLEGFVIGIPMTARQMIEDRAHALLQIKKAAIKAEKMGVGIIGFGALTSSFSKGGLDIMQEVNDLGITTGRAYTTKTVSDYTKKCIEDFNFNKSEVSVAVVGAGGSIGSSCAKILATYGVKNFILIDLEKRLDILKNQLGYLSSNHESINITISHSISDIKKANIIIAATNAPEVVIRSEDLSPGAIVINDAQPSDVDPEILKTRDDVLIIEGGIITTPGIKCNFNFGLAGREDTFCCLGEVLILAHQKHFKHFALGELNLDLINDIEKMSHNLNFSLSSFQNDSGYITEKQINKVRDIIRSK